jgi:ornithine carbamoyltransferase
MSAKKNIAPSKKAQANSDLDELNKISTGRSKVSFHNTSDETGDIFVQLNGVAYQIKREEEVSLPNEVLGVIDDAIITRFERDGKGEEITRDIKRFPYTKVA